MTDATDLWDAVAVSYADEGLISLTNTLDNQSNAVDATVGADAAQAVINLWPIYAQVIYDPLDATHVEVAKRGVIAVLWTRGGTASDIAKVEYDEVFGSAGTVSMLKRTGPRGRQMPKSNSQTTTSSELIGGRRQLGWSDKDSLPHGILPPTRGGRNG